MTFYAHVLFEIAYFGEGYRGMAIQIADGKVDLPTVESVIIKALIKAKLIDSYDSCNFNRAGRTDKNVNARSNYISLTVKKTKSNQYYDYVKILNSMMPISIRVLSAYEVPPWFNARGFCKARTYIYYIINKPSYNIDAMKTAATEFIGHHYFINFCKIDKSKKNESFKRTVYSSALTVSEDGRFIIYKVKGSAFLWHQVRMMVAFLLGVGLNQYKVEDLKLYLSSSVKIVNIAPADPKKLILYQCDYPILPYIAEKISYNYKTSKDIEAFDELQSKFEIWKTIFAF